jgi:hypothetical protein
MTIYDSLHSLLDYERRLFCVTNLFLIYESVTSSASVIRWLAIHSWTLNFSRMSWRLNYEWIFSALPLLEFSAYPWNLC